MWDFLDEMNYNLLYEYSNILTGNGKRFSPEILGRTEEDKRRSAYYLLWFVYRHVLGCMTLKETEPYQNEGILRQYHLLSLIKNGYCYIGVERDIQLKQGDLPMILEILYNRYNLLEQTDCFIRNTKNMRREMSILVRNKYLEILNKGKMET